MARRQEGLSLIEILVATAVLLLVGSGALLAHRAARRAQRVAENRAELQQGLRVALDRIVRDLGAAGFGVQPEAATPTPDEALEGVWRGAVVLRGDLDAHGPGAADPETALGGVPPYRTVTTGNDEIVGFALAPAGRGGADRLVFHADVCGVPRDAVREEVSVDDVDLTHQTPPYTLYRFSVRPDSTGTSRAPLVENVRSLRFTYFDGRGAPIDPPGGSEDPDAVEIRSAIRRIRVELEGLTRDPDPRWADAGDPDPATRHFRKYRLATDIVPRNLGLLGRRDAPQP